MDTKGCAFISPDNLRVDKHRLPKAVKKQVEDAILAGTTLFITDFASELSCAFARYILSYKAKGISLRLEAAVLLRDAEKALDKGLLNKCAAVYICGEKDKTNYIKKLAIQIIEL